MSDSILTKDPVFAGSRAVPRRVKPGASRTGIPTMRRSLALLALAALVLPGCFESDYDGGGDTVHQTVHERFAVAPNAHVTVGNISGSIVVTPWAGHEIDILARKRADEDEALHRTAIEITHEGTPADDVEIHTRYLHEGFFFWGGSSADVDYTIRVPKDVTIEISNVSGDVRVSGIDGTVRVNNVSGEVEAMHIDGNLRIHTVSGIIDASLVQMSGNRDADMEAVSGSIRLAVPPHSSAYVTARSISGDFDSDFNVPTQQHTVGVEATGRIGSGSGTIEMRTISGSMTLSKT
jgi:DUF4097 and DUF4098 domain-containing protein YvlB